MRRRYQVNLYTEHSKHLELIEHLMTFDKNKRSSELTMLLLAGYQVLYGKGDTGLDKSTSMLLDERDHLISLLASRLGQQPSPQPHVPPHLSQPSQATTPQSYPQEEREEKGTGGFRQDKVSSPESPKPKERPEESTERETSPVDKNRPNAEKKPLPKKVYHQSDLTDEDPSIHEVPEPDLEEDIVDPLSLFD